MGKIRAMLGVLIIVLAVGALIFWEIRGREAILSEKVKVATVDILPGTKIKPEMLSEISTPKGNIIEKPITAEEVERILGKSSDQLILKNQQISIRQFQREKYDFGQGRAPYVIKPQWIFTVSSSLRRGDKVDVYGLEGEKLLEGTKVAFVKDGNGAEVVETAEVLGETEIPDRVGGTGRVETLELFLTKEEYDLICNHGIEGGTFVIVQTGRYSKGV